MNKKYIKYFILTTILILGVFLYLFFTLNPNRKQNVQNAIQNLFPFGETENTITGITPEGEIITLDPTTGEIIEQETEQVRQITTFSVAGYQPQTTERSEQLTRTVFNAEGMEVQQTETVRRNIHKVRYIQSDNSYIYDTIIDSELSTEQLTDDFLPNTEEAFLSNDLENFVLRSFNEQNGIIKTYFGSIEKTPITVEVCPFTFPVNLKFQDINSDVANIQRFLNGFLGITISLTGENSPTNETGVYDELTREAVRKFQSSRNIPADGNVGPNTRQQLLTACTEIQTQKAENLFRIENPVAYQISGIFGPDNIIEMSETFDSFIAYIFKQSSTFATLHLRNLKTNSQNQLYDSHFTEWLVQPINQNIIYLTTKASQNTPGYLYEIDREKGIFKKILGDIDGLTTLISPNGNYIIYSNSITSGFNLNLYTTATGVRKELPIKTLPEKCVWNTDGSLLYCAIPNTIPNGIYPDDWYQGLINFNDSIWTINPVTGTTNKILDLSQYNQGQLNAVKMKISIGDRYLYFINKTDKTLWVADLFQ